MSVIRTCLTLAIVAPLLACPAAGPAPQSAPVSPSVKSESDTPSGDSGAPVTAVKAPIFSVDPCESDGDCAPAPTCHPDECVSAAHAGAKSSEMICTMECRGGTADCGYNHCGCAPSPSGKKLCALLPGPDKR